MISIPGPTKKNTHTHTQPGMQNKMSFHIDNNNNNIKRKIAHIQSGVNFSYFVVVVVHYSTILMAVVFRSRVCFTEKGTVNIRILTGPNEKLKYGINFFLLLLLLHLFFPCVCVCRRGYFLTVYLISHLPNITHINFTQPNSDAFFHISSCIQRRRRWRRHHDML